MKKILCVCGTGQGSSFVLRMAIEEMLNMKGLSAEVEHSDASIACGEKCDYIVTTKEIGESITNPRAKFFYITNFINKKILGEELKELFDEIEQAQ